MLFSSTITNTNITPTLQNFLPGNCGKMSRKLLKILKAFLKMLKKLIKKVDLIPESACCKNKH